MSAASPAPALPWTCPYCALLCDGYAVRVDEQTGALELDGSDCLRARQALAAFGPSAFDAAAAASPSIAGRPCDLDAAIAAAAQLLLASHQPLFAGLGTDVAGARALQRLAQDTGAISDASGGAALMHGLRALQDRGAYTTTLAEVRNRADVIVCFGGSPAERQPEFFRRCGLGEDLVAARHVVLIGDEADSGDVDALRALPGVSVERIPLQGDLFDTAAAFCAAVTAAAIGKGSNAKRVTSGSTDGNTSDTAAYEALAARLHAAHYAVLVWEGARLPAHGALIVEALNRVVATLNRKTRAATFPLGGGDGAATANQVHAWLTGLPLRTRTGPAGLEHDPLRYDTARLLESGAVDALLWVSSFSGTPPPAARAVPTIVLGPPFAARAAAGVGAVFMPVATPGIGSAGHLFRTDGVVLLPLHAVGDQHLPTVADVAQRLAAALRALRGVKAGVTA